MTNKFAIGQRVRIKASDAEKKDEYEGKTGAIVKPGARTIEVFRSPNAPNRETRKQGWFVLIDKTNEEVFCFEEDLELIDEAEE